MTRLATLLLAALLAACAGVPGPGGPATEASTSAPVDVGATIVIVRHAEKATDDPRDPTLTEAGTARARALAATLADADVAAVYATQFRRTQLTGAPTAEAAGLTVTVVPITGDAAAHADALIRTILAEHPGRTVLVVGHSNTVPHLVRAATGLSMPDLADDAYGDLFVARVEGPGQGRLVRARY